MTVGLLLVHLTHGRDVIWVTMGILIVIRPDVTSTINSMVVRVLYNLLAIIIAIILAFFFPHQILLIFALIMIFLALAWLPNYVGPSVMALTVFTVLIWPTGTVFENSLARIIDITLGAIIAIICAYVILPSRVTMDLPGLLASTIKANQEYMKTVIVPPENYNHQKAVQQFNNYLLQENNLEAAIGKLQDFFTDISNDIHAYESMIAVNHKLFADISVLGALQEKKLVKNVPIDNQPLTSIMDDLARSVENDVKPSKTYLDSSHLNETSYVRKDLDQYVDWVISDMGLLQELVRSGSDEGIFGKYKDII
nr:FUSC family protein [Methanobacterium petrolearium]